MNKLDNIYEDIALKWKNNKGIGSVYCINPLNYAKLTCNIIQKVLYKKEDSKIFIVVKDYNSRRDIVDILDKNKIDRKHISINSIDYIKVNYKYDYDLIIVANVNTFSNKLKYLKEHTRFMLMIMTVNNIYNYDIDEIHKLLPLINIENSTEEIKKINLCSPVKEIHIGVDLNNEDKNSYDKQSSYINNIMTIIDNVDNIKYIKYGNNKLNLSAAQVRYNIAKNNGWSENLDMNIEFNKQIDDAYNPNALLDKVNSLIELIKLRRNLATDNINKINKIIEILNTEENKDKKFIIISKRGEFAANLTKELNNNNIKCGDYHDCIEDKMAVDNNGIPILIKSGPNKGQPKILKSKAISSLNLELYLNDNIQILSTKNSSLNGLNLVVDGMIITSPICEDIYSIKCRFDRIDFTNTPNIVYVLYSNSTIEQKQLLNRDRYSFVEIINETEKIISYDENSGDIIL